LKKKIDWKIASRRIIIPRMRGRRLSSPLMFQGNGGKLSRRGASFPRRSEVGKTSLPEHATCPEENISGRKRGTMRKWSLGRAGV